MPSCCPTNNVAALKENSPFSEPQYLCSPNDLNHVFILLYLMLLTVVNVNNERCQHSTQSQLVLYHFVMQFSVSTHTHTLVQCPVFQELNKSVPQCQIFLDFTVQQEMKKTYLLRPRNLYGTMQIFSHLVPWSVSKRKTTEEVDGQYP